MFYEDGEYNRYKNFRLLAIDEKRGQGVPRRRNN
jgi:hypothetical protein